MNDDTLERLLRELSHATTFDDAATRTLRPMLERAAGALAASPHAAKGRILRGMVHVRPDDGYRSLAVFEKPAGQAGTLVDVGRAPTLLPSTTAWRWIVEHKEPIAVDMGLGRVEVGHGDSLAVSARRFGESEGMSSETVMRLKDRQVTHLYAVPLRGPAQKLLGMISIEAGCSSAMGGAFVWRECAERLQLIADLAAPYLAQLPRETAPRREFDELLPVAGPSMEPVIALLKDFSCQSEPILLSGPTGAGKSRLARWCHSQSGVRRHAFETVDLSAIPAELQLGELFGYRKGAFTGAVRDLGGVIARADGGTLFVDEIQNLSLEGQNGLLRFLGEKKYRAFGEGGPERTADVRLIVGTNAKLWDLVRAGRFKEDLYYRINVLPVKVPSLRERPDEIALWSIHMAARYHASRSRKGSVVLSPGACAVLIGQPWPGNLRQLDSIIKRAYAFADPARGGVTSGDVSIEEEHVRRAIALDGGDQTGSLIDSLLAAAGAFVAEAERCASSKPLDLDLIDSFKGFVLGAATQKFGGNPEEAFRLFGRARLVASRNHHKVLRRELERVDELCEALGRSPQSPFESLRGENTEEPDPVAKPS